jgi:hypothetical protein
MGPEMLEFFVGFGTVLVGCAVVVLMIVTLKWMIDSGFMEVLACLGLFLAMLWGIIQVSRETGKWVIETGTEQVRSYANEDS